MRSLRAFVTGGATGLARGAAVALARTGLFAHVAVTYRNTPADETLAAIRAAGCDASAHRVDFLESADRIDAALQAALEKAGPFDTLVHGVGPMVVGRFERATLDDYQQMFDGNVRSAVLCAQALLPEMREHKFGRLVFFGMNGSSVTRPVRGLALHLAAKSALVAFARTLAIEEAAHNITVNVVEPGDIRQKTLSREEALRRTATNPRGRPGTADDVAQAITFFCNPDHDFITGSVLNVTGGLTGGIEPRN